MDSAVAAAWTSFVIQLIYGIPCILFNILVVFVLYRKRLAFGKDFVMLYIFDSVINVVTFLMCLFGLKLPKVLTASSELGQFYLALPHFIPWLQMFAVSFFITARTLTSTLFSFNRFTCVTFLKRNKIPWTHEEFWRRFTFPLLCLVLISSSWGLLSGIGIPVEYKEFSDGTIIVSGGVAVSSNFAFAIIFNGFVMLINLVFNILSFSKFRRMQSRKEIEKALMAYAASNFVVLLISLVHSIAQYYVSSYPDSFSVLFRSIVFQATNYINDFRCFTDAFILASLSRIIRTELKRFTYRAIPFLSPPNSIVVPVSTQKS